MQAITSPTPEQPISLTPLPPIEDKFDRRSWWPLVAVGIAGLLIGWILGSTRDVGEPAFVPAEPDLETTLHWMFEAALGYPAVDQSGAVVAPALSDIGLASVEVIDPVNGPIVAIVSSSDEDLTAYEVRVERHGVDWQVIANRVGSGD